MGVYEFDSFQFDARTGLLCQDGREVSLSKQTADLLSLFVGKPGQVLLKDELVSGVWPGTSVQDNSLTFAIYQLRAALGRMEDGKSYIETLPKRGYRFVAAVREVCPEQVHTPIPLQVVLDPDGNAIRHFERERLSGARPDLLAARRFAGFVLVGTIALVIVAGAIYEFRVKPYGRLGVAGYSQLTTNGRIKGEPFTDGVRIYFPEQDNDGLKLVSVAVEGGSPGELPIDLKDTIIFDVSPFRSEVLAARNTSKKDGWGLWVIPLLGGPPRRVGDLRSTAAVWSRDKTQIASILGSGLFLSASDGSGTRKIATVAEGAQNLRWSPNEKTLRFCTGEYRNGDSLRTLWEINVDGSSLRQLLPGWNIPLGTGCGDWTPDGSFYIFYATKNNHTDLWAIPGGKGIFHSRDYSPVRLSFAPLNLSDPAISSDGKHLFAIGEHDQGELVRYDSGLHDFVKFLGGISATWAVFSRSGRSVAYISHPDLTVWRANADGSNKTQITFSPLQANGLSWSPDEKWLAVRARTPGHAWRIYLVPSESGTPEQLIPGEKEQGIATWSPDGTRLCFGDVPAVFGTPVGTEAIHIFDTRTHTLSDLPGSQLMWTSRWSPDGRYISALTIEGQRLKLFDFSTNSWRSTRAAHVNTPNWTSDSKFIYYDTEPQNRMLQRVRIADGEVEQLADLHDFGGFADWWSGLSPKNDALLLRNRSSTEIYSLALEYK